MFSKILLGGALLGAVVAQIGSPLIINTPPSVVECQPALIAYSGGTPPYFISVLPAGEVAATPLLLLPDQNVTGTYTWEVDLPAGTNFTLSIRDGTGALNYAAPTVIQPGTSTECINATAASAVSSLGATAAITGTRASSASGRSSSARSTVTRRAAF